MAWRRLGNKPLYEPMLTWFTDTYAALGGDELSQRYGFIKLKYVVRRDPSELPSAKINSLRLSDAYMHQ